MLKNPLFLVLVLLMACSNPPAESAVVKEKIVDVDPELIDLPERTYLVFREQLPLDNMTGFFGIESKALVEAAVAAKIKTTGPVTGLFYRWDTEAGMGDAAVALPVEPGTTLKGYVPLTLPAGQAFAADLTGPYTGLGAVHYALEAQFKLQKLKPAIPSIEEYHAGPVNGVPESAFRTRVIYPIAD
ncbi:hypothetical protein CEQ90_05375 [Lewinellaceae bacterium SD302]|nr:hypothetical protein CEQ90_05375 [Lewinellaceae bacterium SD302]